MSRIILYDTTLRDGAQREGISFSVQDKLKIVRKLDDLGIHYVEGGWPGSNPKDTEFFQRAPSLGLKHSILVAFGSTRRPKTKVDGEPTIRALLEARTGVVTIVGKTWDLHVTSVLQTTLEENLRMIADSVAFLKANGLTVFFDAEHFFDGYKANPNYALETLGAAARAKADCLVLCDTNGGSLPSEVMKSVKAVQQRFQVPLGIHAHNDAELAVANSLAAVQAGITQVQGTINGYGERCGNANLCSIIPALKLKMGINCLSQVRLAKLTEVSHFVNEIANLSHDTHLPYVGANAFTHKAGYHVSSIIKCKDSYHHIKPDLVGNKHEVLISELSGKANIRYKARERGIAASLDGERAQRIVEQIKELESRGFQYDGAEASFELLVHRSEPSYRAPFELVDFMVVVEKRRRPPTTANGEEIMAEATVKVKVGSQVMHTAAEGNGPVNALDQALRKALLSSYPELASIKLVDYKVRILEETAGTGSQVRVLIESSDGKQIWRTVGSSSNIIEASWLALADSLEYALLRRAGKAAIKQISQAA
ncbi:MAG: citramalate synthase [Dehalococcoidia bacterium]|nr:citramalate synthase [Dehalococcoidia bacterium]